MNILVTGTAGFIGHFTALALAARGHQVTGIDSINDYYDVRLKLARLAQAGFSPDAAEQGRKIKSSLFPGYTFTRLALEDRHAMEALFNENSFDAVCSLAAQAGVRYSLENPRAYIDSNINGFINILEGCRSRGIGHLVYASSSSVYGLNSKMPFSVSDNVDHPVSLYAATKKANELMAHSYSSLYNIPTTGLRFFTVYGPWGRPDMAYYSFAEAILQGQPIKVFNNGDLKRDFTYIDDVVEALGRIIEKPAASDPAWDSRNPDPAGSPAPYKIYNIGNSSPVGLLDFISTIERALGKEAEKIYLPMQAGDVYATYADVSALERDFGYSPSTTLETGIRKFAEWFMEYRSGK